MIMLRQKALLIISGLIWFAIGIALLMKGLNFLMDGVKTTLDLSEHYPMLSKMMPYFRSVEQAALVVVAIGLFVGFFKGKFVLGKSALRGIERIRKMPEQVLLTHIYSAKYYILLGVMASLGMLMNVAGVPADIRGFVDVAVGSALINGSMFYFRNAMQESRVCST